MDVAVGKDRLDLIVRAESEARLRLFTGAQALEPETPLGLNGDPLDIVVGQHRVFLCADLDMKQTALHIPYGDVNFS